MDTLIAAREIQDRIRALAVDVRRDHPDGVHLVCVLKGAFMFLADLMRALEGDATLDFIAVSSYGVSTKSSGQVQLLKDLGESIEGRDVVIVEDIVDTGLTLNYLQDILRARAPQSKQGPCARRLRRALSSANFPPPHIEREAESERRARGNRSARFLFSPTS